MSKNIRDRISVDDRNHQIWLADEEGDGEEWYGELSPRRMDGSYDHPSVYILYMAYEDMAAGDRWLSVHSTREEALEQMYSVFEEIFDYEEARG